MRNQTYPILAAALALAALASTTHGAAAAQEQAGARPKVGYADRGETAVVTVDVPKSPGLACDIWCYEDQLGKPVDHRLDGQTLVLTHRLDDATVTSRFVPADDGVEVLVEVTGPDADGVKAVASLNPCWQLRRSKSFGGEGHYVEDFVARCFVILQDGLTLLKDTRRVPGTRDRPNDKANLPNPWIQEYFPAWRRHPGQIPGQRGYSPDRPVLPLIGCVSRDGKHLAAFAWPETRSLGQVWHHCLHPRPAIGESYDTEANRIVSRGRLYFLPNDETALRAAFRRDFPDWRRPPDWPEK
ncbi:MAG: hypothetical protein ACYTG0_19080 [Planctomycetota bacterium]|jgi:hypothetical protein